MIHFHFALHIYQYKCSQTLLEFLQTPLTFNSVGPVKPTADLLASVSYKKHSEVVISPGIFFVLACMYSE